MRKQSTGFLLPVFFAFAVLFSITAHAQGNYDTKLWRFSNPKPFGFNVLDLKFIDENTILAVGSEGGIARSADAGKTWTYGAFTFTTPAGLPSRQIFQDLHVVDNRIAYAVGNGGMMAKTTDGGVTWTFIRTPFYNAGRNINAVWFTTADIGYIGGQYLSRDSIPKLYFTRNGGTTWDSIAAPKGGLSRIGYINNPNVPAPRLVEADAKDKEILAIQFTSTGVGYISGTGLSTYLPIPAVNSTTGLPTGGNTSTGAHHASLLWKFSNGTLTDYSLTKERLGYDGVNANPVLLRTTYGNPQNTTQSMRAMHIINDSAVLLMSFNNNIVVRVNTGRVDITENLASPGTTEPGKYITLNFPFPPLQRPSIPAVQTLLVSNPYRIVKANNGKLFAPGGFGLMATSIDTGRTWRMENNLPAGKNFSGLGTAAIDIAPSGRFMVMGQHGVQADSSAGRKWASIYETTPAGGSYFDIEFADCNNGIAVGGGSVTVTNDGGKTWIDRVRMDFAMLNISINGLAYPAVNRALFATSIGTLYRSTDGGANMTPIYANPNYQLFDVTTSGDTIWAVGYSGFSVPAANRTSSVFRSVNNGTTWQVIGGFATGSAVVENLSSISFANHLVGYVSGNRGAVYKTTDGGTTWTKVNPFPALNTTMNYKEIFALDANTVFVVGNGFPRKVVYRSNDAGATWADVTSNITALGVGNLNGILMHDANNGFVVTPGMMLKTTNGGSSWTAEIPTMANLTNLFEGLAFAPKRVPAGTKMESRKLFVAGVNISGAALMEYGDSSLFRPSFTESITPSCTTIPTGTINVTASGGIAPYTYAITGRAAQASSLITDVASGLYTLTITDAACQTSSRQIFVGALPVPFVNAGPDKITVQGDEIELIGFSSSVPKSISWTPAAGILSGANDFRAIVKPTATTTYRLTVVDANNNCTGTDDVVVTVVPYCVKVMNAFTPNGDGQNDRWLVTSGGACTISIEVKVYNRYGGLVFRSDNYQNNWDGNVDGKAVPTGTYYYSINYKLVSGRTYTVKGDVTILR